MAHRRGGRTYSVWLTLEGKRRQVPTGATTSVLAKKLEVLRDRIAPEAVGEDVLYRAVYQKRVTLLEIYNAEQQKTLPQLRARLDDIDLAPHLDDFEKTYPKRRKKKVSPATVAKYRTMIERFAVDGKIMRSSFDPANLSDWLAGLQGANGSPITSGTRRHHHIALRAFWWYLRARGIVKAANPLIDVDAPAANDSRMVWYPVSDLVRLIELARPKYRLAVALIQGTGAEVSALWHGKDGDWLCKALVRHIDTSDRSVMLYGTKREWRVRPVAIDEFAWPAVAAGLKGRTPNAPLFDFGYWAFYSMWKRLRKLAGMEDYTIHDARHSYAVRHVKEGWDYASIGGALGHRDGSQVAKNYGRFRITRGDYRRVQERAERSR